MHVLNKYRVTREGVVVRMNMIFCERLTTHGRFTLEGVPIKDQYKHEVVMNEFVIIADKFGLS
jgi:hypothetical protein